MQCQPTIECSFSAWPRSVDAKSSRRRPSWLDVGEVEGVELCPQDVAFVAQRFDDGLLFGAGGGVIERVLEGEGCIFRRFGQSRFEVVESGSEIRVVLAQFFHAQRDQVAREKFGEGGGYGFEKSPRSHQVQILV